MYREMKEKLPAKNKLFKIKNNNGTAKNKVLLAE